MKRLYVFTNFYPYSFIECFLEDEINYLAKEFDEVYLVPYYFDKSVRKLPRNCKLIPSEDSYPYKREISFNRKTFLPLLKELLSCEVILNKTKLRRLISVYFQTNHILNSKRIKIILSDLTSKDVLYFYWGVGANIIAAFADCKAKKVSRFHGQWDLWEDEYDGYLPFRKLIMANLDAVVAISNLGRNFIQNKYPYAKTHLIPLGSNDYGPCVDKRKTDYVKILSCSVVIPLKRVDLIFRSLLMLKDLKIKWTHIGGGEDFGKIKNMTDSVSHPNLEVNFLGRLTHEDVMDYLKNNKFDVFVNLSTLEGVPVSIMEAISFDIPVVATNVGGTSDVVSSDCGLMVSPNPSEVEVANCIREVLNNNYSPRLYWEDHYSADKNYGYFSRFISNL